ncbi:DedA family protein [Streptacidiphilus sp. ASG 303]|uniref:DedA family protein n=1 Tax=Streptomycetaceae TaxID=2062 RepID=UPI001E576A49|nr:VTT domain-containing protein [Streptacidiphilus sp. ASG 303]MCD0486372.1 VTT domain-containing protein [Streptacidiphilus sp. ASG 303]
MIHPLGTGLAAGAAGASSAPQAVGYPMLFLLVAVGAVLPVLPTGALVSAAAAVAWHSRWPVVDLPVVLGVAAAAAWVGDVVLYWLAAHAGGRWARQLGDHLDTPRMRAAQERLDAHDRSVLVLSRLVPAGRIPVMAACLVSGWTVARFLRSDVLAAVAWALCYQAVGVLGGALFPQPWQGVAAAVGLVLLAAAVPALRRRLHGGPAADEECAR